MSSSSNIEWTDATWNPIVGCSIVSPGCTNCYAMKMAARIEAINVGPGRFKPSPYIGTTKKVNGHAVWTGKVALAPEKTLLAPLRWKKPRRIFVNSMGDLFHESAPDEWIDKVFAVMALCPQHQFQVLTKRAERMREYMSAPAIWDRVIGHCVYRLHSTNADARRAHERNWIAPDYLPPWPLPNVWLGVSAERQQEADERIPHLLQTPAAIRFVSCEPLIGPITFRWAQWEPWKETGATNHLDGLRRLNWIIAGGESGPGARPMHPDWARSLRDECAEAGVPFFFKQWGAYRPNFPQYGNEYGLDTDDDMICAGKDFPDEGVLYRDGYFYDGVEHQPHVKSGAYWIERLGKKAAGRLLDGKEHNGFPG